MDQSKVSASSLPVMSANIEELSRRGTPDSRTSRRLEREKKPSTLEDHYHTEDAHLHYPPKRREWHPRPKSPRLKWHKDYTPTTLKTGRVLVIDYVKQDLATRGKRRVTSQEIDDVEGLRKIYSSAVRGNEAILRVFHVQNATPECTEFLLQKFNINARDDLVGLDLDRYLRQPPTQRRRRKPMVSGKAWRTQHDPWRGLSKTAFSIDYFKPYRAPDPTDAFDVKPEGKIMELDCLDHDDNPCYGWDVHVQRLSCYIQHKERAADTSQNPDLLRPTQRSPSPGQPRTPFNFPHLDDFDNGDAILIFEESQSGSIEDTVIPFRRHIESRWRRLPFYLAFESKELLNDDQMSLECAKMIMQDIWRAVSEQWENFLEISSHHVGILVDKIYENPANEALAPLLWTNSDNWLSAERLMAIHVNVVKECQANLMEASETPDPWLEAIPGDFKKLSTLVQEDLVKPTVGLTDLMYKSVGIRDARHSLELSMSLWRLSWITFIFLPLTFLCGFFSMSVDVLADHPSLKWYFVAAAPMMSAVFASWFFFKRFLEGATQNPYARGVYETLFQDLATSHPLLWTRTGPRQNVRPRTVVERLKWWFIIRWSAPKETGNANSTDSDNLFDGLSTWSRIKRQLMRQWTEQIEAADLWRRSSSHEMESASTGKVQDGSVDSKANSSEQIETLQVPFDLTNRMAMVVDMPRRSQSAGRPSTGSSGGRDSGVMVEEERLDWLENP